MSYKTEWYGKVIHWTFCGQVGCSEVLRAVTALYGDSRFDGIRAQIRDVRQIEEATPWTVQDIVKLAAYDSAAAKTNPAMKVAIVTTDDEETAGALTSLYSAEIADTPWEVEVFQCVEDALAWIG